MPGQGKDLGSVQLGLVLDDGPATKDVLEVFDPARLTQARVLVAKTKQEVAKVLGVSAAAVGQWEAGLQRPREDHLAALAELLGVPRAFFAAGRPCIRVDGASVHFRSLRSTRSYERGRATAFVEQVWELTHALEKRVELPPVDVPGLDNGEQVVGVVPRDPVLAAQMLRSAWSIPSGPFQHLVRTVENHGVVVSHLRLADEDEVKRINAFSLGNQPRPIVVTTPDRADDVMEHRFTVGHELGHLLFHPDVAPGDLQQEREADQFASELLTPAEEIASELPTRLQLGTLTDTSARWGVSVKMLIRRAHELGKVGDVSARRAYQRYEQLRTAGMLRPEPILAYRGEAPALLRSAFQLAEKHSGLTLVQLANELVWEVRHVRLLLGIDDQRPSLTLV